MGPWALSLVTIPSPIAVPDKPWGMTGAVSTTFPSQSELSMCLCFCTALLSEGYTGVTSSSKPSDIVSGELDLRTAEGDGCLEYRDGTESK